MLLDCNNLSRYLDRAIEIEDFLQYRLNVTYENEVYSYSDFCGSHCETSDAVSIFLNMYRDVHIRYNCHIIGYLL